VMKARLLARLLGAPVLGWRWALIWAAAVATLVGYAFTALPRRYEWSELVFGIPLILLTFGFVIWRRGFTSEDRALFRMKSPKESTP